MVQICRLVLENLARLHGVTHVMMEKAGGSSEFLKTYPHLAERSNEPEMQDFISKTFEPTFGIALEVLQVNLSHS